MRVNEERSTGRNFVCCIYGVVPSQPERAYLHGWVRQFVTLFADDSNLCWTLAKVGDLNEMQRHAVKAFALFKQVGMIVNPEKSTIVIAVRGRAGQQWIKAHTINSKQQKFLNLGSMKEPIRVLTQSSTKYLGVLMSYGAFALQTFLHR